jgi:hypothetical protein
MLSRSLARVHRQWHRQHLLDGSILGPLLMLQPHPCRPRVAQAPSTRTTLNLPTSSLSQPKSITTSLPFSPPLNGMFTLCTLSRRLNDIYVPLIYSHPRQHGLISSKRLAAHLRLELIETMERPPKLHAYLRKAEVTLPIIYTWLRKLFQMGPLPLGLAMGDSENDHISSHHSPSLSSPLLELSMLVAMGCEVGMARSLVRYREGFGYGWETIAEAADGIRAYGGTTPLPLTTRLQIGRVQAVVEFPEGSRGIGLCVQFLSHSLTSAIFLSPSFHGVHRTDSRTRRSRKPLTLKKVFYDFPQP